MELASRMSEAWELAQKCVGKAQKRQKAMYDRKSRPPNFTVGERVFLLKPSEKTGEDWRSSQAGQTISWPL